MPFILTLWQQIFIPNCVFNFFFFTWANISFIFKLMMIIEKHQDKTRTCQNFFWFLLNFIKSFFMVSYYINRTKTHIFRSKINISSVNLLPKKMMDISLLFLLLKKFCLKKILGSTFWIELQLNEGCKTNWWWWWLFDQIKFAKNKNQLKQCMKI